MTVIPQMELMKKLNPLETTAMRQEILDHLILLVHHHCFRYSLYQEWTNAIGSSLMILTILLYHTVWLQLLGWRNYNIKKYWLPSKSYIQLQMEIKSFDFSGCPKFDTKFGVSIPWNLKNVTKYNKYYYYYLVAKVCRSKNKIFHSTSAKTTVICTSRLKKIIRPTCRWHFFHIFRAIHVSSITNIAVDKQGKNDVKSSSCKRGQ